MKIRSVRPEFFADPMMAGLDPMVRLLYIGLWCYVDDYGRGEWLPKLIEGSIFPLEDIDVHALLEQLVGTDRIVRYTDGDRDYFWIPTFSVYQKPNRQYDSRLPVPEDSHPGSAEELRTQRVGSADDTTNAPPVLGSREREREKGDITYQTGSREEVSDQNGHLPPRMAAEILGLSQSFRLIRKRRQWPEFESVLLDWSDELDAEGYANAVEVFVELVGHGYADTPNLLRRACEKVALMGAVALEEDPDWAREFKL